MGDGVFGIPFTRKTLESLPEYEANRDMESIDWARVALKLKNWEGKDERALEYLLGLKQSCRYDVGTLCLVYNATGDTIKHAARKDWAGHIGPSPYPLQIANGQWGAFLHVKGKSTHSNGAVVYHGKDADGSDCDWLLAWNNPWEAEKEFSPRAYIEVRDEDYFAKGSRWAHVVTQMQKADVYYWDDNNTDQRKATSSYASIGKDNFPIFTAILTLKGV